MATVSCCNPTDHEILLAILATLNAAGGSTASVAVTNVIPGTGASDLGKAEDSPHTSGDVGVEVLAVRNDAGGPMAADGDYTVLQTDAQGRLRVDATLETGDIEIGAVEIKNGTDDTRAVVKTDGTNNALVVFQNVQPLPTGAATEATLATRLAEATFTSRINTLGQKAMAASTPVVIASDQSPIAVTGSISAGQGTLTDGSGTIAVGGTDQVVFAANAARRYLVIQNNSAGDLWIDFTNAAVQSQPSLLLTPNGSFEMAGTFVSTEEISIIGATTGQTFTAKEG